jgi:hypothetical protein
MSVQARTGLVTTVLMFAGGVLLFLAPFLVEYQKVGQDWIDATKNDLWTGGVLIGASVLTLVLFLAFAVRDAVNKKTVFEASEVDQAEAQG